LNFQEDIQQVRQALESLVGSREADRWLAAPNLRLGGIRPIDAIENGRMLQVLEMLILVQEGIYV
jgi:uncharacterized protein (DUF2384 family)